MIDPRRALPRTIISAAIGVATWAALSTKFAPRLAALGGWNAGGLALLAISWFLIVRADAKTTARRAATEDFGRTAVYVLVILASGISLFAAVLLVRQETGSIPEGHALVVLCVITVAMGWTMTHTAFTTRYAHLYYRGKDAGGVDFPGGEQPSYLDFAYMSFTVGMTFQVSDTDVTRPHFRHAVLLHAVLSFAYNTAILAFVLNLLVGMAK
jgi:uncharacterized membrane protein